MPERSKTKISSALLCILAAAPAFAARSPIGPVDLTQIDSAHPYPAGGAARTTVWTKQIGRVGAEEITVYFSRIELGKGDLLVVRDANGNSVMTYDQTSPKQVLGRFPGASITLELVADDTDEKFGVTIPMVAFRMPAPRGGVADGLCFNDLKDITCFKSGKPCDRVPGDGADDPYYTAGKPVARLTLWDENGAFNCTGFMIEYDARNDLMMTAAHCIKDPDNGAVIIAGVAEFNAEYAPDCANPGCAAPVGVECTGDWVYFFDTCWWDDPNGCPVQPVPNGCDWAVVRLHRSAGMLPGARHGKLVLSAADPPDPDTLYIPQHPAGRCKEVDDNANDRPTAINGCYIENRVDVQGGSSGSPVLRNDTNEVVGIASCTNCDSDNIPETGHLRATRMSQILANNVLDNAIVELDQADQHAIPTVSEWGMIVMIMLVLVGGTMVFRRRSGLVASARPAN